MDDRRHFAINLVAFQLGWFACVLGAARGAPWLGPLIVSAVVLLHLRLARRAKPELLLLALCLVVGVCWESLVLNRALVTYPDPLAGLPIAPLWIIAMWPLFGTTLNVTLRFLKSRLWLAALLGASGGPLAYFSGQQLGALTLTPVGTALLWHAAGWAVLMPLLVAFSRRQDGVGAHV